MNTLTLALTLFLLKVFSGLYLLLQNQHIIPFPYGVQALCNDALTFWLARLLAIYLCGHAPRPAHPAGRRMLQVSIAMYVLLAGPLLVGLHTPLLRETLFSHPDFLQWLDVLRGWLTPLAEYLLAAGLIWQFAGLQPVPPPAQAAQRRLNRLLAGLGMTLLLWSAFGASAALLRWRLSPQAMPDATVTLQTWLANGAIILAAVTVFLTWGPLGRRMGHSLPQRDLMLAGIVLTAADLAALYLPAFLPVPPWLAAPLLTAHLLCDNAASLLLLIAVGGVVLAAAPRTDR